MKKKKKKYLELYYKWMEKGLPNEGLCACIGDDDKFLELFVPTDVDKQEFEDSKLPDERK